MQRVQPGKEVSFAVIQAGSAWLERVLQAKPSGALVGSELTVNCSGPGSDEGQRHPGLFQQEHSLKEGLPPYHQHPLICSYITAHFGPQ